MCHISIRLFLLLKKRKQLGINLLFFSSLHTHRIGWWSKQLRWRHNRLRQNYIFCFISKCKIAQFFVVYKKKFYRPWETRNIWNSKKSIESSRLPWEKSVAFSSSPVVPTFFSFSSCVRVYKSAQLSPMGGVTTKWLPCHR